MATDFLGQTLNIGDDVIFLNYNKTSADLERGKITKVFPHTAEIGRKRRAEYKIVKILTDAAPVVYGRWGAGRFNLETGNYEEQCTRCRNFSKEYGKPYCPNCGAKMQGSENHRMGQNVILSSYINVDMMDREDAKNELARQAGMCVEQYIRENDALIERDGMIGWRVAIYKGD